MIWILYSYIITVALTLVVTLIYSYFDKKKGEMFSIIDLIQIVFVIICPFLNILFLIFTTIEALKDTNFIEYLNKDRF